MSKIADSRINLKIISVIFAVVLWLYVASEQNPVEFKNIKDVPVRLTNTEAVSQSGLSIKDMQDYKVDVSLQGKRSDLSEIKVNDILVEADLRGFTQKGVNNIPVEIKGIPTNVDLVDVVPRHIKVNFEAVQSVQTAVNVVVEGTPATGYTALKPLVVPVEVLVKGPESLLSNIKVQTASLKLNGATGDVKEVVPVKVIDSDNNEITGIELNPNIVEVTIPVRRTKVVPIEIVTIGSPPPDREIVSIRPVNNSVAIYGEESLVEQIASIKTEPIDVSGMQSNQTYPAQLILPDGILTLNGVNKVDVGFRIERIITNSITLRGINLRNLAEGLRVENAGNLPAPTVELRGREDVLNQVIGQDIDVYANLANLGAGSHTVTLQIELPNGVELISLRPVRVDVSIVSSDVIE